MVTLSKLLDFLERVLGDPGDADPDMANGLQFRGKERIKKIVTGVSASLEFFRMAVSHQADCIIVHHGMVVPKGPFIDPLFARRLGYLASHKLTLLGYHYLLDSHPELGHSAQIIHRLGAQRTEPFRNGWGWYAEFPQEQTREGVLEKCLSLFGQTCADYLFGPDRIRRLVVVTGGGSPQHSELPTLMAKQVDLYITGQVHEWDREEIREAGLNLIAGGHYSTERFGLWALGDLISKQLQVEVEFVDFPNEI